MPLDQNPHQTVTRFGCVGISMYACGFSVPQMWQFFLFIYPPWSKWASSEKMVFFATIGIICKSIAGPFCEAYAQPYSFVGRIKLIICQIRYELSVTRFIWKDDFFFAKIGIFCKSICRNISQRCSSVYTTIFVRRKDKTNYLSNQTWAKCYHSRNKHLLKKTLDGGPYISYRHNIYEWYVTWCRRR